MKIFITGATGYIGQQLALKLAADGRTLHALVRDVSRSKLLLDHPNIQLFEGDILNSDTLRKAMAGCTQVYHLAALASVWHKNPNEFQIINVEGLKNVLNCCLDLDIKDVLFTSTAGVVGHSTNGEPVCEYTNPQPHLETLYEQSKVQAETLLIQYAAKGIRGIIVNPSRVYGPGLLTESNGFTRLMKMYINGQWKIKPGNGESIGNYVFIDDTINGLILAMRHGEPGKRYLLGGVNATYNEFFDKVDSVTGKKRKLYNVPLPVMLGLSYLQLLMAHLFGKKPMITPPFVRKYNKHWIVSSDKAITQLGYTITPLPEGISKTVKWLNQSALAAATNSSYVNADS
jgi:nucleoside-diphosphate-sugar epimerase